MASASYGLRYTSGGASCLITVSTLPGRKLPTFVRISADGVSSVDTLNWPRLKDILRATEARSGFP